ncbi:hypothetical protein PINS_up017623 [Pythium insidiosum]|nr:hypothetical protein PINS_up017623 [Pythium insidiosum]
MERLLCVIVDVQISVFTNVVLPTFIVVPYLRRWNVSTMSFPPDVLYNDHRFTTVITENRSIFALSTLDGLSKLLPHLGIFAGLRALRGFVRRPAVIADPPASNRNPSISLLRPTRTLLFPPVPAPPPQAPASATAAATPVLLYRSPLMSTRRRFAKGLRSVELLSHAAIVVISVVVLALHLRAAQFERPVAISGCEEHVRPWFADSVACVIREFNCHRHGVESPDESALEATSNAASLITLMITHCTALRMPVAVRSYPNLISFEVYNSTIVEWNESAALDASTPQQLAYLALVKCNMSRLPDGLVVRALPPVLRDIEIVATNLTALPSDLHERWHHMNMLYIERSAFLEVPETLRRLAIDDFSMAGNAIEAFPPLNRAYIMLTLSRNPIHELPSTVSPMLTIETLGLEGSAVSSLPAWTTTQVNTPIRMWGTPFCDQPKTHAAPENVKATCAGPTSLQNGRYPLEFMMPLRQP